MIDFFVEVESGRENRILQLTDMQIIDSAQRRYPGRLNSESIARWATDTVEENCYKHMREVIKSTNPDLILITGDIVYGEFDDNGTVMMEFVEFMDSFEVPWAPIFGNHDNESAKGVDWQCQQFTDAEYCLFKRGFLTGNSNYSIGVTQNSKLVRVIYMMDSNHSFFGTDQLEWVYNTAASIESNYGERIPSFACYHIPTNEFHLAAQQYGNHPFTIGENVPSNNGDFGYMGEAFKSIYDAPGLLSVFKNSGIDGVFVGHNHIINTSILYEGIRWTFGLKTGLYDRYLDSQVGGTYIEVAEGGAPFRVEHVYL